MGTSRSGAALRRGRIFGSAPSAANHHDLKISRTRKKPVHFVILVSVRCHDGGRKLLIIQKLSRLFGPVQSGNRCEYESVHMACAA